MARPRDREEAKTQKLNMRVTPSFKERLEAVARIAGRPAGSWAEEQLNRVMEEGERSAGTSDETRDLLKTIERHINEIEQATGTPWPKHIGTWAAVWEMLRSGPIMAAAPAMQGIGDKLDALRQERAAIEEKRAAIIEALSIIGIEATSLDTGTAFLGANLFGQMLRTARDIEREKISQRDDLPEPLRESLLSKVAELETLDEELQNIDQRRAETLEPVREAIEQGQATYERPTPPLALAETLAIIMEAALAKPARRGWGMFGS